MCVLFGAMTGVFGRPKRPARRFQQLCRGELFMTIEVVGGIAASVAGLGHWKVTLISSAVAGILSLVVDILRLRPTALLLWLFAFTTTAIISFPGHLAEAALATGITVAFILVLARTDRTEGPVARSPILPRPGRSHVQPAMAVRTITIAMGLTETKEVTPQRGCTVDLQPMGIGAPAVARRPVCQTLRAPGSTSPESSP